MWNRRQFLTTAASSAFVGPLTRATSPIQWIDSHVHVWKHDPAFPFAAGSHPPAEDATPETLLALMRANNVARTVIIQVSHYHWDNRYLASVLKQYPHEFQGVCRVNPEDPAAPDHLSALAEQGFRGVRLSPAPTPDGDWIRGPLMPALWRRCAELKVPMTLLLPATRLPDLHPLIEANPDLQVVIDHMADTPLNEPDKLSLLLALSRYPNVFVKISHMWSLSRLTYPYPDALDQVKRLCDTFGPDRLMWGTDWPISLPQPSYTQRVALYRDHLDFLSSAAREQILCRTVQRIWPFHI